MRSFITSLLLTVAFAGVVCAQAPSAPTQVLDTITSPSGPNPSGNIVISWGQYQNNAVPRQTIYPGSITVPIVNGALNVSLFPNAAALPISGCYQINYHLNTSTSVNQLRYWYIPISPTPVTLSQIEGQIPCATASGALIAPGQIADAGATTGQVLTWNGFYWSPANGGGGGGGNPGGMNGQIQFNSLGAFGGFTIGGDCTLNRPNLTCLSTNGIPFAPSATTNALNASNINLGTLGTAFGGTGAASLAAAGIAVVGQPLSQFTVSSTSAQLLGILSDATGTGSAVFNNSPTFVNPALGTPASGVGTNFTGIPLSTAVIGVLPPQFGGTGVSNTARLTLGTSNQNWATLGTGIVKNTTFTGAISNAAASDVYGLWSGPCSSSTFLRGDGTCSTPLGAGTVTNTSGPLTLNAVMIGNGGSDSKTLGMLGAIGYVLTSNGPSSPPSWQPAGGSGTAGYNFCASGCAATIPSSGTTISAATHGQGVSAWAWASDSGGVEMAPPYFSVTRDSSGDLTFNYVTAPTYIAILGGGSGGGGGGSGVGWSVAGSLVGTSALSNFTSSSGITLTGSFPSSVFTLNVAPDTTVLQTKANLQTGTCPNCLVSSSASGTAYAATTTPTFGSYSANSTFRWTIDVTSTSTAPTLAVNGLTATTVFDHLGNALTVGALSGGSTYTITYTGSKFLCSECGIASSLPGGGAQTQYLQITPNSGGTTATQWNSLISLNPLDYNYSVTPSSPSTLSSGSHTITLAVCPLGIYTGGVWAPVYLTAGSGGTAEATTPTGGTCSAATLGSAGGTVIVTLSNSHGAGYLMTSATNGIQEALGTACAGSSPGVKIPAGNYTLYAIVSLPCSVSLRGAGLQVTVLDMASGFVGRAIQVVTPTPSHAVDIGDFTVAYTTNGTGAEGLYLQEVTDGVVSNLEFINSFNGITGVSIGRVFFDHINIFPRNNGFQFSSNSGSSVITVAVPEIHHAYLTMQVGTGAGVLLAPTTAGILIDDLNQAQGAEGIEVVSSSGATNEVSMSHSIIDSVTTACVYMALTSTATAQRWDFTDNYCSATTGDGFDILEATAGNFTSLHIVGNKITLNASGANGIHVHGVSGAVISNNIVNENTSGTGNGILIDSVAQTDTLISGNVFGLGTSYTSTGKMNYGIFLDSTTHTGISILNNRLYGVTGGLASQGAAPGWMVQNNIGVDDVWPTVASASSINLLAGNWYTNAYITGTTSVTTLNQNSAAPPSGRSVTFVKSDTGSLTIGGGGNIPGTHTLTQYSRLTLTYDSTAGIWN